MYIKINQYFNNKYTKIRIRIIIKILILMVPEKRGTTGKNVQPCYRKVTNLKFSDMVLKIQIQSFLKNAMLAFQ